MANLQLKPSTPEVFQKCCVQNDFGIRPPPNPHPHPATRSQVVVVIAPKGPCSVRCGREFPSIPTGSFAHPPANVLRARAGGCTRTSTPTPWPQCWRSPTHSPAPSPRPSYCSRPTPAPPSAPSRPPCGRPPPSCWRASLSWRLAGWLAGALLCTFIRLNWFHGICTAVLVYIPGEVC